MRGWSALAIGAVGLTLGLAACGEDREEEADTSTTGTEEAAQPKGAPVATVRVSETDFKLNPANPKVAKAGLVEFRVSNDGKTVHALEVEGPEGEVETDRIQPGQSTTLKADLGKPGRYVWYCPVGNHRELGMEGRITVAGGGSGAGTTETESETEREGAETEGGDDKGGAGGY